MNLAVIGSSVSSITSVSGIASVVSSVVSSIDATVANGSIARHTSVAVVNSSDDSNIVGVASGVGVMLGKAIGNLAKSVGIRISLTLAVVVSTVARVANVSTVAVARVASRVTSVVSTVANSSIAGDTSMTVVNTSDHTNVVGVASGIGVGLGKAVGNLAEGVGIRLGIRVSLGGNDGQEDLGKMLVR